MIKLIAFDIDDTLTKEPRTVPQANLDAVKRAQDAGIFVTVATARGFHGSSYIWQAMGVQGPIINYGGAVINDTVTGKALYTTELDPRMVKELLALAKELNVHAHIYQGDGIVFAEENPYVDAYSQRLGLPRRGWRKNMAQRAKGTIYNRTAARGGAYNNAGQTLRRQTEGFRLRARLR